jgi:acyl dehydratase
MMTMMTDLYFDDLEIGQVFESVGRTITNHDVLTYAGITGDNNEVHTNDEYAKNTPFKTRIVHGILVVGIASGLTQRLGIFNRSAMAALDLQWTFKAAVLIGDTIRIRITIEALRETSKGGRGIVTRAYDVLNQRDEVVQTGKLVVMMHKKPS